MRCVVNVKTRGRLPWKLVIQKSLYHGQTQVESQKVHPETVVASWILNWELSEEDPLIYLR